MSTIRPTSSGTKAAANQPKLTDPAPSESAVPTAKKAAADAARAQFNGIPVDPRPKAANSRTVPSKGVEPAPTGPADSARQLADLAADLPVDCATARKYSLSTLQDFLALGMPLLLK
jgi:hypothetical protein